MMPAIQNIPIRTEIGQAVREAFVKPLDKAFPIDYSSLELRIIKQLRKQK
jgi:DNA polymerase I-like protein with 3'-5' exonuclease and polymerase domains